MDWLPFFVAVTAVAVVLQLAILAALYFSVRRTSAQLTGTVEDLRRQITPILARVQPLTDDLQPRLSTIVANAAEVTELARGQAYKVDRVFTEAVDRLRLQVVRADQLLTGFLETVEETGTAVKRGVWAPVQQATAVIRGVKAGLDFFRNAQRSDHPHERARAQSEEELFI